MSAPDAADVTCFVPTRAPDVRTMSGAVESPFLEVLEVLGR